MNDQPMREVDLRADGLLWLINAAVFHPRGFALAVHADEPGRFSLVGDGHDPWRFPDDDPQIDAAFQAAERLFASARDGNRPAAPPEPVAPTWPADAPHSRACGIRPHDHGVMCSTNCPTCGGKAHP